MNEDALKETTTKKKKNIFHLMVIAAPTTRRKLRASVGCRPCIDPLFRDKYSRVLVVEVEPYVYESRRL